MAKVPSFPYLQKPGEQGATRWLVDVSQVRRFLEKRDTEKAAEAEASIEHGKIEQAYRDFWSQMLRRGYQPNEIAYIRDKCFGIEDLRAEAKRRRVMLNI